jgi:hypothetical protein
LSELSKVVSAPEQADDVQAPACMLCGSPMRFKLLETELSASQVDAMTYRCEACGTEVKRRVKRV